MCVYVSVCVCVYIDEKCNVTEFPTYTQFLRLVFSLSLSSRCRAPELRGGTAAMDAATGSDEAAAAAALLKERNASKKKKRKERSDVECADEETNASQDEGGATRTKRSSKKKEKKARKKVSYRKQRETHTQIYMLSVRPSSL